MKWNWSYRGRRRNLPEKVGTHYSKVREEAEVQEYMETPLKQRDVEWTKPTKDVEKMEAESSDQLVTTSKVQVQWAQEN